MKKPSKKWLASMAIVGLCAFTASTYDMSAHGVYSDSNVSVSTAVDRYIQSEIEAEESAEAEDEALNQEDIEIEAPKTVSKGMDIEFNGSTEESEDEEETEETDDSQDTGYVDDTEEEEEDTPVVEPQGDPIALIKSGSLRVREEASINSACLAYLPAGGSYLILSEGSEWTYIQVNSSLKGYVHNDYITITKGTPNNYAAVIVQKEEETETPDSSSGSSDSGTTDIPAGGSGITSCTGQDIANYAVQFVGNPYVYGGTSLTEGADCSGFVMRVYADHGISLTRTAYYQAFDGIEVSISQLVPGDLIIFDYGTGTIQHVGIYIGNNQYVHAANSRLGIVISTLNSSSVYTCRRIIY